MDNISCYFEDVKRIIKRGGPEESEYKFITNVPDYQNISLEQAAKIHEILSPILHEDSLLGHTFHKPYGYSGDFELIDKIYSHWLSKDEKYHRWDKLYHSLDCAVAVRNRKKYFISTLVKLNEDSPNSRVLNLGSGPCTDLLEYLEVISSNNTLMIECLDMDEKAIKFSSDACSQYQEEVTFFNKNAFRFKPDYQYNLIWSAGLFDYFSDKLFVRLLNRYYGLLERNGEMIIGNFSTSNPSRGMMETFAQWYLHHRSPDELIDLALKAGIPRSKASVKSEELGVNLFLHINK